MPWEVRATGDEWCVYKVGESKPVGCHASRSRAVAQQKALYANEEAQTAAAEPPVTRVEVIAPTDSAAPALVASIEAITERLLATEDALNNVTDTLAKIAQAYLTDRAELTAALTAAVAQPAPEAPIVHVNVPTQEAPVVNVAAPDVPDVHVTFQAPESTRKRTVKFDRDLSGRIEAAEIEETEAWPMT
jgi:hypothetical protein